MNKKNMLAVIKILAYEKGIFVTDDLYKELEKTAYSGYRTTSGVFFKIGATKTEEEFLKEKGENYEHYLKEREWVTSQIFKMSAFDESADSSYLKLGVNSSGKLVVYGEYVEKSGARHDLYCDDLGVFKQGEYDDSEAVAIQAGGIRARVSICGSNCISGCRFCSFGSGAKDYKKGTFTTGKLEDYIKPLIRNMVDEGITQLFITGGNPSLEDMESWTQYLQESVKEFISYSEQKGVDKGKLTIDAMLTPRGIDRYVYDKAERKQKYLEYCKILKDAGVQTVSPNMELWSQEKLDEYCPGSDGVSKSEIGQDGYLDFIDAAVEVFGPFNVRSALIVGLNSEEETKQAIDALIARGCYVTLSPFKAPEVKQADSRYAQSLHSKQPSVVELVTLSRYLSDAIDNLLGKMPLEQRESCERNIQKSLNPHNSHNTSNLCYGRDFDRLERSAYELGHDSALVTNIKDLLNSVDIENIITNNLINEKDFV